MSRPISGRHSSRSSIPRSEQRLALLCPGPNAGPLLILLLRFWLTIIHAPPLHNKSIIMASKNTKVAAADDELDRLFEGIEEAPGNLPTQGTIAKSTNAASLQAEQDALAELESLGAPQPAERPHTPRVAAASNTTAKGSPAKRATATPPPATSARSSEEKASNARKSGDSTRSFHTSFTPSATSSELQDSEKKAPIAQPAASSGGGWWGGLIATASAAVKTAEAAVKEIQQNEEAKRWAEQVKGNVGALRGFGMHS